MAYAQVVETSVTNDSLLKTQMIFYNQKVENF